MTFTVRQFEPPAMSPLTGDYARDMQILIEDRRRLNVAISEWIAGLEDKDAIRLDQAQITAPSGIIFPSGTLSDYVPPTAWTPAFTCATPGDLSVAYSNRHGRRWKIGSMVVAEFGFTLTTFTHTTASGNVAITGLTDASANETDYRATGSVWWAGITKAGYTNVVPFMFNNDANLYLIGSGSGVAVSQITMADMPTGGAPQIRGSIVYHV